MFSFLGKLFCNHSYKLLYKRTENVVDINVETGNYKNYGIHDVEYYECERCKKMKKKVL